MNLNLVGAVKGLFEKSECADGSVEQTKQIDGRGQGQLNADVAGQMHSQHRKSDEKDSTAQAASGQAQSQAREQQKSQAIE